MITIADFIKEFYIVFAERKNLQPWEITGNLPDILKDIISHLGNDYKIENGVAIHKTAIVEHGVTLKPPVIIGEHCFVGANAYLRGGVYLGKAVIVGPGCEIKTSIIFDKSTVAHFNFIGDSIIGSNVNIEAGAVTANHHNDRQDKIIFVSYNSSIVNTRSEKFGALVGDDSKIGANAVLSPGTILKPGSVVKRLELIDQQLKVH